MLLIAAQPVLAVDSEALGDELDKVKNKPVTTPLNPSSSTSSTVTHPKVATPNKPPVTSPTKPLTTLASAK